MSKMKHSHKCRQNTWTFEVTTVSFMQISHCYQTWSMSVCSTVYKILWNYHGPVMSF